MSNALIAAIVAIGAGAWIGNLFYKRTGGNYKNSLVAGALAGILIFLVLLSAMSLIPK